MGIIDAAGGSVAGWAVSQRIGVGWHGDVTRLAAVEAARDDACSNPLIEGGTVWDE
jgi:hypothetical protein